MYLFSQLYSILLYYDMCIAIYNILAIVSEHGIYINLLATRRKSK